MRLRIATCRPLPEPDPDEQPLLEALARAGIEARTAAWADPREDWDAGIPTLIRSTWDYHHHPEAFLAWLERAARAAPVFNPAEVVRDNLHKRYLLELERRGCAIVPTVLVARGEQASLERLARERGWSEVVVKPAISAASYRTRRVAQADYAGAGQQHLTALLAERDALVQRFEPAVEGPGERALVWIDGQLTHAVRKAPRLCGDDESVSAALPIAPDERALALQVLAPLAARLLYARVDLVRGARGQPLLLELELIEPSLFLCQHPSALERLVAALRRRLA